MDYHHFYHVMADGTVKQENPFTGTKVWTVPSRGAKPLGDARALPRDEILHHHQPEDYCAFCEQRLFETAPEKARLVLRDGRYEILHHVSPSRLHEEPAEFRRVGNLFEIVSLEYWRRNYNYKLSPVNLKWKSQYQEDETGLRHLIDRINFKLSLFGKSDEEIHGISVEDKLVMCDAFFGGGHEMIITRRHYAENAHSRQDLFFTGDLTEIEHEAYVRFVIDSLNDITANNRYVRYVSVFKNWLGPAGASYDHLHTQLVAIDEWGRAIERQVEMLKKDRNVYNVYGPNFAGHHNLVFAENEHAIAFVGIGHRYPTVEVFSKSVQARPGEHGPEEVRDMSDLVRAVHAAIGKRVSVNEEWYYAPFDCIFKIPWHIFIKLRVTVPAGFEGGTNIFINPLPPTDLRDRIVPRLYEMRAQGQISPSIRIAEECRLLPNPLQYIKNG